jgi:hypothetical protein
VRKRSVGVGAAALAALVLGSAHVAHATTQPGTLYVSPLVIRDDAIKVRIRPVTWADKLRYVRGAEVRYEIVNRGTRRFSLNILGSTTGVLAPGRRTSILVAWTHRGRFVFHASPNGARLRVTVT